MCCHLLLAYLIAVRSFSPPSSNISCAPCRTSFGFHNISRRPFGSTHHNFFLSVCAISWPQFQFGLDSYRYHPFSFSPVNYVKSLINAGVHIVNEKSCRLTFYFLFPERTENKFAAFTKSLSQRQKGASI